MQSKTTFLGYTLWSSRLITIIKIYVHTIILSFSSLSLQISHFTQSITLSSLPKPLLPQVIKFYHFLFILTLITYWNILCGLTTFLLPSNFYLVLFALVSTTLTNFKSYKSFYDSIPWCPYSYHDISWNQNNMHD